MIAGTNLHYELAEKAGGTAYGGLAAMDAFAKKIGLPNRIDNALHEAVISKSRYRRNLLPPAGHPQRTMTEN